MRINEQRRISVLNDKDIDLINASADSMIAILLRFPGIREAGKAFYFSATEQPDPLRFICESNDGGYVLEFELEIFHEHIDQIDLLAALLHIHILENQIYPSSSWKCFRFTSAAGLQEVDIEIPKLEQKIAS